MLITRYDARWRFGAVAREFTRDLPWQIDPTSDSWSYRQLVCPSFIFKVFFVVYLNYGNEFHCIFIYLYFSNKIDCSNEMSPMKIEDTWETLNRSCAVHLHCSLCLLFWLKAIGYMLNTDAEYVRLFYSATSTLWYRNNKFIIDSIFKAILINKRCTAILI